MLIAARFRFRCVIKYYGEKVGSNLRKYPVLIKVESVACYNFGDHFTISITCELNTFSDATASVHCVENGKDLLCFTSILASVRVFLSLFYSCSPILSG